MHYSPTASSAKLNRKFQSANQKEWENIPANQQSAEDEPPPPKKKTPLICQTWGWNLWSQCINLVTSDHIQHTVDCYLIQKQQNTATVRYKQQHKTKNKIQKQLQNAAEE